MSDGLTDRRGGNENADAARPYHGRLPPRTAGVAVPMRPPSGAVDPFAAQRRSLEAQAAAAPRAAPFTESVERHLGRVIDMLAETIQRVQDFNERMIGLAPPVPTADLANTSAENTSDGPAARRVGMKLGQIENQLALLHQATVRLAEIG